MESLRKEVIFTYMFLGLLTHEFCWSCSILFTCSLQDLDLRCEQLIKEEFGVECNFDVDDAVKKLEKFGIVSRVRFLN